MKDNGNIGGAIIVSTLVLIFFLVWYIPKYSQHSINATKTCSEIFKSKSSGYFGDVGTSRFIFNEKLNTCLLLNINLDISSGDYRQVIIDIVSDKILFYYDLKTGETKDATLGLTRDEALDKVRELGFIIF